MLSTLIQRSPRGLTYHSHHTRACEKVTPPENVTHWNTRFQIARSGAGSQLLPPDETPEGLVENVAGLPAAAGFTFLRDEPVGVLVGERDWEGWGGGENVPGACDQPHSF